MKENPHYGNKSKKKINKIECVIKKSTFKYTKINSKHMNSHFYIPLSLKILSVCLSLTEINPQGLLQKPLAQKF
jgi:hypothetical protein